MEVNELVYVFLFLFFIIIIFGQITILINQKGM